MSTYSIQNSLTAQEYATLSDFVARLTLLTQRGHHVADVAVLVPESSVWAAYTPPDGGHFLHYLKCNVDAIQIDKIFRNTCHELLSSQRDFDCLSEDLLGQANVDAGCLKLAGESFRTLIFPEMRMIRHETLAKARSFLESGGKVVFVGCLPHQTPRQGDDRSITTEVNSLLTSFPQHTLHVARGQAASSLVPWIDRHVPRQVRWAGPAGVRLLHRRESNRELVLVANPGKTVADGNLSAPAPGTASIWDPETGKSEAIGQVDKGASLSITVPAESARFLVVEQ